MKSINRDITIFSAMKKELSSQMNDLAHAAAENQLNKLGFKFEVVEDNYNGDIEKAFLIVHDSTAVERDVILNLAKLFRQESVLIADEKRFATLIFLENQELLNLGVLKYVENIDGLTNYTKTSVGYFTTERQ